MKSILFVFSGAFLGSFIYDLIVEVDEIDIYRMFFLSFFITFFYIFFKKITFKKK